MAGFIDPQRGAELGNALKTPGSLSIADAVDIYISETSLRTDEAGADAFRTKVLDAANKAGLEPSGLAQEYIKQVGDKDLAALLDVSLAKVAPDAKFKFKDMMPYTIRDMLEQGGLKETQAGWKRLVEAGFDLDEPFEALNDYDRLLKLKDVGATEADFKNYLKGQNALDRDAVRNKNPRVSNVFGANGVVRDPEFIKQVPAARQARNTAAFEGIPEAKITLKNLTSAISQVPDPDVRAALAFNSLVPLRPIEVAKLQIDDIDFETGSFTTTDDRGTKVRAKLRLPEVALGILEQQAEKAKAAGHTHLFYNENTVKAKDADANFRGRMTAAFNAPGGMRDMMAPYEDILGRKLKGTSDLRKLIPSIIAQELGYKDSVSKIMGHTSLDAIAGEMENITAKHYVSGVVKVGEGATETRELLALRALQNAYAEVLDLPSVNSLVGSMNLDIPSLTADGAPQILVAKQGQSISAADTNVGEVTPEVRADIDAQRAQATAMAQQRAAEAEQRTLQTQAETARIQLENEDVIREAAASKARIKEIEKEERDKIKAEKAKAEKPKGIQLSPEEIAQSQANMEKRRARRGRGTQEKIDAVWKKLGMVPSSTLKALPIVGAGYVGTSAFEEAKAEGKGDIRATAEGVVAGAGALAYDVVSGAAGMLAESTPAGEPLSPEDKRVQVLQQQMYETGGPARMNPRVEQEMRRQLQYRAPQGPQMKPSVDEEMSDLFGQ